MSTKLRALFDGTAFRPSEAVSLQPNTECILTIEALSQHLPIDSDDEVDALTAIAAMAIDMGVTDLADRHHEYAHPVVTEESFAPAPILENEGDG